MSPKMEVEVARYLQMTPEGLASLIATSETMLREMQSMLAAMRKAQKRNAKFSGRSKAKPA